MNLSNFICKEIEDKAIDRQKNVLAHQSEIEAHTTLSMYFYEHLKKVDKKLADKTKKMVSLKEGGNYNYSCIKVVTTEIKEAKSTIIDLFHRKAHFNKQQ